MYKIRIYEVQKDYIDYLKSFDELVPAEHPGKKPRKYIGIVFEIDDCKYFAPLFSPKSKHKRMKNDKDFMKINGGKHGAINFNNMIPVHDDALIEYDIENDPDIKYQNILEAQARFIRKNKDNIRKIAKNLHEIITSNKEEHASEKERLGNRCCKFKLLEQESKSYEKK